MSPLRLRSMQNVVGRKQVLYFQLLLENTCTEHLYREHLQRTRDKTVSRIESRMPGLTAGGCGGTIIKKLFLG